ncbi:MAG: hypothetical protein IIA90_06050 [Chloroflexi bacterium]|nr:hypothetical protein [Chloroflexota bacterium]
MSKKNRKRREITRHQKEQRQAKAAAAGEGPRDSVEEAADDDAPEDEASTIKRRADQKHEYEKRKRAKARGSQPLAPYFWGGGVIAVVALAVLGGFLLLGGGGDGGGATPAPSATPDPRIAGLPIDQTITVDSDDDGQNVNPRFIPNAISGNAGDVIEIINPNIGSVPHNLRFAGLDGEYDTADDWLTDPPTIFAGDTGRVVVKFDEPGVYPFKCASTPRR